jgi:hypothetical protein
VLKESPKPELRTKRSKYQALWNATFKEIAAFRRVIPSDLGVLERAAARERARDSIIGSTLGSTLGSNRDRDRGLNE